MRKIKTILGIVFSLAIVTTMNTTVFAANDSGKMCIRDSSKPLYR